MRSPTLTLKMLERVGACDEAMEALKEAFPGQKSVSIKKLLPRLTKEHPDWLKWCLTAEEPSLMMVFVKAGADPNIERNCGCTELHFAAEHGDLKTAKGLLEAGAEVNRLSCVASDKVTPLDFAGISKMKDLLRKYGAKTKDQLEDVEEKTEPKKEN